MGPVHALYASVRENSAFHFLGHPHWSNLAEDDLLRFDGLPAVEAYNGVCERAIARGFSEPAWDFALSTGRRLLGMAVDDSHVDSDFGRGWIMLKAEKLDRDAVIDSLRRGLYYSTCGPQIRDFRVEGTKVSVRCSPCWCVKFITNGFNGENVFHETDLIESATHELTGRETYLRVQVEDVHGRRAYTNPVYFV
jgi:hypothetical protein